MTLSITSQIQAAINILTGSTVYQGIDGYLCDSDVYPDILPSVVLSYYLVRKMAIFGSEFNCVMFDCMQLPAFPFLCC